MSMAVMGNGVLAGLVLKSELKEYYDWMDEEGQRAGHQPTDMVYEVLMMPPKKIHQFRA